MPISLRKARLTLLTRRLLLTLGGVALFYPVLRFIGFHVPKKPLVIEIAKELGPDAFYLAPQFILFSAGKKAWAVSRKCTHLGCTLNYSENDGILICPCHQSHFSKDGLVLQGPSQKPLRIYAVKKSEVSPFFTVTM